VPDFLGGEMAIDSQFIKEVGRPYIHSDIFHFRSDIHNYNENVNVTQRLEEAINILEDRSSKLKTEAE
jgi:hypothetical protein